LATLHSFAVTGPLGWNHINLTGDYVFSDAMALDGDGFMPLRHALN